MPAAATSLPTIITKHNQYVYRATKPAHGPRYISAYSPNEPAAGCSTAISASAHITVNVMSAPAAKLKITAGPASFTEIALVKKSPVPIVLPSAIMATCAALNWCCKPASRCTSSASPPVLFNCFGCRPSVIASHANRVASQPQHVSPVLEYSHRAGTPVPYILGSYFPASYNDSRAA